MAEYDVNEILKKEGFDHIDLGNGESCEFTKLDQLLKANANYKSWAKRVIDTSNSGFFQIATFVCQTGNGEGSRKHYHPDTDEWWVVIKGIIEFSIGEDDKKFIGEPGDVIFCKKGLTHKITVLSDDPCIRLAVCVDNQETILN
jgi:quercetin dioxygenase-like cupin family protein